MRNSLFLCLWLASVVAGCGSDSAGPTTQSGGTAAVSNGDGLNGGAAGAGQTPEIAGAGGSPSTAEIAGAGGAKALALATHWTGDNSLNFTLGGANLWVDPVGVPASDSKADFLFLTHSHTDHMSQAMILALADPAKTQVIVPEGMQTTVSAFYQGTVIPMKVGDRQELGNFSVTAVPAYNVVKVQFHPQASGWLGYVFQGDGLSIYVTGDTERVPEMQSISADLVYLPLGQTYTMSSVDEAAEVVRDVHATVAVPVHWGTNEGRAADVATFRTALEPGVTVVQLPNE